MNTLAARLPHHGSGPSWAPPGRPRAGRGRAGRGPHKSSGPRRQSPGLAMLRSPLSARAKAGVWGCSVRTCSHSHPEWSRKSGGHVRDRSLFCLRRSVTPRALPNEHGALTSPGTHPRPEAPPLFPARCLGRPPHPGARAPAGPRPRIPFSSLSKYPLPLLGSISSRRPPRRAGPQPFSDSPHLLPPAWACLHPLCPARLAPWPGLRVGPGQSGARGCAHEREAAGRRLTTSPRGGVIPAARQAG